MKELDFNLKENPFYDFFSTRYAMTARINVEKLWNYCKKTDKSFFIMSLGCLMNAVNSVPQLKRRIINDKAYEFDYLEGLTPIMEENNEIYKEMKVETPQNFNDILDWHDYVRNLSNEILSGKKDGFLMETKKRDVINIANFSCIPWVDFDTITSIIDTPKQTQPLVTWGKVNKDYEMSVAITVSHIFVNGRELGYFYENAQKEFDNILDFD